MELELLAPAKNYEQGKAAIDHGADAIYIGAPAFGARSAATNSIEDIERLVNYAHIFHSKVFATVNTLLFDDEIDNAVAMCHKLYSAGCDALIIQDMGLLECELPPIELHASTQTHNIDIERIKFMERVGFKRVILARETSLEQMTAIRSQTKVALEAFVQGALCVCYSGQCYMSQYLNGRSGNRGCCSQPCRSSYNLVNENGKTLIRDKHLLSLKDFSAAENIESMVDAGITSFKIEGRLKDIAYVKNTTAYYRKLLDQLMNRRKDCRPASSGRCTFSFTPDLEKTFNRGFTDYFQRQRQPLASFDTQKSMGKPIGIIIRKDSKSLTIRTNSKNIILATGDGLCCFDTNGSLEGFNINIIKDNTIVPSHMPTANIGAAVWRNHDHAFERLLQGETSKRKIDITLTLDELDEGLMLTATDSDGCNASATLTCEKKAATNPSNANEHIERQLAKVGDTPFAVQNITNNIKQPLFLTAAQLNELRRRTMSALCEARYLSIENNETTVVNNNVPYYEKKLDYKANVLNTKCKAFYQRHGAAVVEWGLERSNNYEDKALMTTKYCLRYELGKCLKQNDNNHDYNGTLFLVNNGRRFKLCFDCKKCQMLIKADTCRHHI